MELRLHPGPGCWFRLPAAPKGLLIATPGLEVDVLVGAVACEEGEGALFDGHEPLFFNLK